MSEFWIFDHDGLIEEQSNWAVKIENRKIQSHIDENKSTIQ
jgi:hypothetical protein